MATLQLEILTPDAKIFDDHVESVVLPGIQGEMGILPQHIGLMTQLVAGELRIVQKGKTQSLAIGEGMAEITGSRVSVLTASAMKEGDIDEQVVQAAIERAQQALKSADLQGEDLEAAQATLARSIAQINLKRRRR